MALIDEGVELVRLIEDHHLETGFYPADLLAVGRGSYGPRPSVRVSAIWTYATNESASACVVSSEAGAPELPILRWSSVDGRWRFPEGFADW